MDKSVFNIKDTSNNQGNNVTLKENHRKNINSRAFGIELSSTLYHSEISDLERCGEILKDTRNCQMISKQRYDEIIDIFKAWKNSDTIYKNCIMMVTNILNNMI